MTQIEQNTKNTKRVLSPRGAKRRGGLRPQRKAATAALGGLAVTERKGRRKRGRLDRAGRGSKMGSRV